MATKRQRSAGSWEYVVRRKGLLPKPLYFTFSSEAEGDAYVARLERLLDAGVVPQEFVDSRSSIVTGLDAIREYVSHHAVSITDRPLLNALASKDVVASARLASIDYRWVQSWVTAMKREENLSPSTIRHYVGALARCFDWCVLRPAPGFPLNPIRLLPRRYATYSEMDQAAVLAQDLAPKADVERDRRLPPHEEKEINLVLAGARPRRRQRPLTLPWQAALELLFVLAVETAMRLREMYTLSIDQVDLAGRTVALEKTKNGDKRPVPLSTVAVAAIKRYQSLVAAGERGMAGFSFDGGWLFPWWDGDKAALGKVSRKLSNQFSRVFDAAGCPDLIFHDLRHEATSRLYEKTTLTDLQIAKITGHKTLAVLRRYANLRGSDLAARLW